MPNHHDHYDGAEPIDHSHDHGQDHSHEDDQTPALQNLLYQQIDTSKVTCLNEAVPQSGRAVLQKTWAQRFDPEPELRSDADEQLLLYVPFTGQVRLHEILLRTSTSESAPSTLKVFVNQDNMDFEVASQMAPTQVFELPQSNEVQPLAVQRAKFSTARSLTLFFEDNWGGDDTTIISYIAFKGDFMQLNKEPVSFLYEAAANPADHQAIVGTKIGGAGHNIRGA
ncbi:uncharacterized protein PV09_09147 [Verruconis gallopava]|uniref:PITH domain-containing protein n=1 Tax=Verruconis gallopava TaxID=253628 RepID=A0A0D1YEN7_9PEZI|nr:uncharacterized protein PV09_09147 [Verruconis gallopava]KIV99196.1 hypothetical protein PV09_09147 [Verruconis gallopava]